MPTLTTRTAPDTVPCPYCRAPIHEDAERCPKCENYISREDAPSRGAAVDQADGPGVPGGRDLLGGGVLKKGSG